jgi:hypothetical protein
MAAAQSLVAGGSLRSHLCLTGAAATFETDSISVCLSFSANYEQPGRLLELPWSSSPRPFNSFLQHFIAASRSPAAWRTRRRLRLKTRSFPVEPRLWPPQRSGFFTSVFRKVEPLNFCGKSVDLIHDFQLANDPASCRTSPVEEISTSWRRTISFPAAAPDIPRR